MKHAVSLPVLSVRVLFATFVILFVLANTLVDTIIFFYEFLFLKYSE